MLSAASASLLRAVPRTLARPLHSRSLALTAAAQSQAKDEVKKVALVLSGCGVYDGSEVHEASAAMVHLSRNGAYYQVYAPDEEQLHVIDHTSGEETKEKRNSLVESARIARGDVKPLKSLDIGAYDALIIPGGFGAAKNLSNFAVKGADAEVLPAISATIRTFHSSGKPIGMCCIAPTLAALTMPDVTITMGSDVQGPQWPHADAVKEVERLGAKHVVCDVTEIHVDEKNKLVTAPAYMCETKVHEVHDNVGQMVKQVLEMA